MVIECMFLFIFFAWYLHKDSIQFISIASHTSHAFTILYTIGSNRSILWLNERIASWYFTKFLAIIGIYKSKVVLLLASGWDFINLYIFKTLITKLLWLVILCIYYTRYSVVATMMEGVTLCYYLFSLFLADYATVSLYCDWLEIGHWVGFE